MANKKGESHRTHTIWIYWKWTHTHTHRFSLFLFKRNIAHPKKYPFRLQNNNAFSTHILLKYIDNVWMNKTTNVKWRKMKIHAWNGWKNEWCASPILKMSSEWKMIGDRTKTKTRESKSNNNAQHSWAWHGIAHTILSMRVCLCITHTHKTMKTRFHIHNDSISATDDHHFSARTKHSVMYRYG